VRFESYLRKGLNFEQRNAKLGKVPAVPRHHCRRMQHGCTTTTSWHKYLLNISMRQRREARLLLCRRWEMSPFLPSAIVRDLSGFKIPLRDGIQLSCEKWRLRGDIARKTEPSVDISPGGLMVIAFTQRCSGKKKTSIVCVIVLMSVSELASLRPMNGHHCRTRCLPSRQRGSRRTQTCTHGPGTLIAQAAWTKMLAEINW
jgi:hypothetical protein